MTLLEEQLRISSEANQKLKIELGEAQAAKDGLRSKLDDYTFKYHQLE